MNEKDVEKIVPKGSCCVPGAETDCAEVSCC